MIVKTYISENLNAIERKYNKSQNAQWALFYSKLALLELCGWIEISMDDIIRQHAKRCLKIPKNLNYIEEKVISPTYGFDYNKNFRRMLISLIGMNGIEKLEKKVDPACFNPMKATLGNLKVNRDKEAHGYIKGTTMRIDAPSITKAYYKKVYDGLKNIDTLLRSM